jgi:hypothetical protein
MNTTSTTGHQTMGPNPSTSIIFHRRAAVWHAEQVDTSLWLMFNVFNY